MRPVWHSAHVCVPLSPPSFPCLAPSQLWGGGHGEASGKVNLGAVELFSLIGGLVNAGLISIRLSSGRNAQDTMARPVLPPSFPLLFCPWLSPNLVPSFASAPFVLASGRRNMNTLLTELFEKHLGGHILQSLDGFVFALNQEGKFLYISETVSIYLGLSQGAHGRVCGASAKEVAGTAGESREGCLEDKRSSAEVIRIPREGGREVPARLSLVGASPFPEPQGERPHRPFQLLARCGLQTRSKPPARGWQPLTLRLAPEDRKRLQPDNSRLEPSHLAGGRFRSSASTSPGAPETSFAPAPLSSGFLAIGISSPSPPWSFPQRAHRIRQGCSRSQLRPRLFALGSVRAGRPTQRQALCQVELTGSSIFDYVHPGDHHEVAEQLGLKAPLGPGHAPHPKASLLGASPEGPQSGREEEAVPGVSPSPALDCCRLCFHPGNLLKIDAKMATERECQISWLSRASCQKKETSVRGLAEAEGDGGLERSFFIRLKSTLTKRGLHIKTSGYKVIHVTGCLRSRRPSHSHGHSVLGRVLGLVALAHTLPPSTLSEVRIECHMFVFRVNMDLQIVYCESRISDYMDLCPSELVGKSCYRFIHGEDVEGIQQSHLDLLNKGQVVTRYYRWLQKSGGFVWVQSCATISINVKNPSERNMVWVNYILSKPECKNIALDVFQVPGISARQTEAPSAGTDYKESDRGKPCPASKPAGTLAQSYPRSVAEMGRHCHLVESKSRGPETKYLEEEEEEEEEALEEEAGSDTKTPPRKRIKLEFPLESPPPKGKGETLLDSSEDSDSSSDSEPEMVPQQTRPLARKVNGCKPGGRKTMVPGRPCMSEFTSVIQTQKGASLRASPALSIKSEQGPRAKGGLWTCLGGKGSPFPENKAVRLEKPLVRQAPSHLFVSIPDSVLTPPEMDIGPVKGPFSTSPRAAPSSSGDTLSPPLSGSPCEDRGTATPFTPLIYPTEMEVLQRFHTSNVVVPLMHQLGNPHASSSAGSPGLYTTSTIRYAPADMTLAMPSNMLPPSHHPLSLMDIGSAEAKTSREIMYHHLQRLNMVAPFGNSASLAQISGGAFTAADSLFSTLPFSVASGGIHSGPALERKED
ncbi:neuronal PAS domain-containing protein 3-like [Crotalus adamanteus]|uniref:Neuronal PAS domain-containing protein 3-like n=1 Tax=Crotalus adamanteus TaxID=8729 RepID=A0AAW1AWE0_CROAD